MINNLELILCAKDVRSIEEPTPARYQEILESDILSDTQASSAFAKFPIHMVRVFKKGNKAA